MSGNLLKTAGWATAFSCIGRRVAWFPVLAPVFLAGLPAVARAADCLPNAQQELSVSGAAASCTETPGSPTAHITAGSSGQVTVNGVQIAVPSGTAVTAQSGGVEVFGVDPVLGGSSIFSKFGGGGIIGLLATGTGSQIIATGLTVNLAGGGDVLVEAASGGQITLLDGTVINIQTSGGNQGLLATGAGSQITASGITLTGNIGGGDFAAHSTGGATIRLTDSTVTLGGNSGGKVGLQADTGSTLTADNVALTVAGSGADVGAKADTGGTVTLTGGSVAMTGAGGGEVGLLAQSAGSTVTANGVAIFVSASQGGAGARAAASGGITLGAGSSVTTGGNDTPALQATGNGSTVNAPDGVTVATSGARATGADATGGGAISLNGGSVTTSGAQAAGFSASSGTITADDLTTMTTGAAAPGGVLQNGGTLAITGGSVTTSGPGSFGFLVQGASGPTNTLGITDATVSSAADAFHIQGSIAGIGVGGSTVTSGNGMLLSSAGGAAVTLDAAQSSLTGAITTDAASTTNATLHDDTIWTVTGTSNLTNLANNASSIVFAPPTGDPTAAGSYKTVTMTNYTGSGGAITLNTYLGDDTSPSDGLVINGGTATGTTRLTILNTTGPGAETQANGISVVRVASGSTAPGAFTLAGELRAGAFDYDLFRGGVDGSNPDDWFLRSSFIVPGPRTSFEVPEPPSSPPSPVTSEIPILSLPVDPPPRPLPPGAYPIIGPEIATYGVVQPIAREMGLAMLGTLHERIGNTLTGDYAGADNQGWGHSGWGRFFGHQLDNRYQAFADPQASGQLFGFQLGFDLWRGSLIAGHQDAVGIYFAYGNSAADVNGLVTNLAANGYVLGRTGTLNLDGYSGGAYWTHYGPSGWYLDAVLQGTAYSGHVATQFDRLPTNGDGLIASLEAGYPVPLPLGPGFVLEPQAQIIWQRVDFGNAHDSSGPVALGTTSGTTGRFGLRGQWHIDRPGGRLWQPYLRANLWHDWDGDATTTFSGANQAPLREEATRLEFAAGVTARLDRNFSLYAQAGYQFAVADTDGGKRDGVLGDLGVRYSW